MSWVNVSQTIGAGYYACDTCGGKSPAVVNPGADAERLRFLSSIGWVRWERKTTTTNGPAYMDQCAGCAPAFGRVSSLLGAQQCAGCGHRWFLYRRCPSCQSTKRR